jgi:phosphate starvation-inducible protein PhoH
VHLSHLFLSQKDYKVRLEEAAKTKARLERETVMLRHRADAAEAKAAKAAEIEKETSVLRAGKVKLEKLCRTLQAERANRLERAQHLETQSASVRTDDPTEASVAPSTEDGGILLKENVEKPGE